MKRIISLIALFTLLFTACEGPPGPPGITGPPGQSLASTAFEIEIDFVAPNYSFVEPYGFEVLPTDVTLVYVLWETLDNGAEVWRLTPQTVIFDTGDDLVYNYDFTQTDVRFFLEGSNLAGLGPEWTTNQVFRVVVIPADNVGRVDYSDLNTVMQTYGITKFEKK